MNISHILMTIGMWLCLLMSVLSFARILIDVWHEKRIQTFISNFLAVWLTLTIAIVLLILR